MPTEVIAEKEGWQLLWRGGLYFEIVKPHPENPKWFAAVTDLTTTRQVAELIFEFIAGKNVTP